MERKQGRDTGPHYFPGKDGPGECLTGRDGGDRQGGWLSAAASLAIMPWQGIICNGSKLRAVIRAGGSRPETWIELGGSAGMHIASTKDSQPNEHVMKV